VTRIGTDGPDTLRGTNGADNLLGEGGDDVLYGLGGRDDLVGGPGEDWVLGGNERRPGGGDKDLVGGPGNDGLLGGRGSDGLVGEKGNDLLSDGPFREFSEDTLSGGAGDDVFGVINRPAFEDVVMCGGGFDRVLADTKDEVAPDCERVFIGLASAEEFEESIPQSFFEGLAPFPEG
jgi:Ca2+-binding RTX toxin-like protein